MPYDAAYRTVEYCVDSNCSVFNLFSAGESHFVIRKFSCRAVDAVVFKMHNMR